MYVSWFVWVRAKFGSKHVSLATFWTFILQNYVLNEIWSILHAIFKKMCICFIPWYDYGDTEVLGIGNWHYILVILVKT